MAVNKYNLPTIAEVRRTSGVGEHGRDHIHTCDDISDLWNCIKDQKRRLVVDRSDRTACYDSYDIEQQRTLHATISGDMRHAHHADEYLEHLRSFLFVSQAFKVRDDVEGATPNVPAFLAGQPFNMRNKRRAHSPMAPLCMFLELTASSGVTGGESGATRAACLFALAQVLAEVRPVQLWATITYGSTTTYQGGIYHGMVQLAVRLNTTPFDVAQACNILMHPDHYSNFGHSYIRRNMPLGPSWAYDRPHLEKKYAGEILGRIVHPGTEVFYVPAAHLNDLGVESGKVWLKAQLQQYAGDRVEFRD